ncbi:MAG: transglutaminase family protein [Pseudomonadota bacterium]
MIYNIRVMTISTYENDVPFARHILRLTPIDRARQRVLSFSLEVEPKSSELVSGEDFFGNRDTSVACSEPHQRFIARAAMKVEVTPLPPFDGASPPWEDVAATALSLNDLSPHAPAHYLYPSRMVGVPDAIRVYAQASFPAGRSIHDGVVDLNQRLRADILYDGEATTVSTTPEDAFALRRGVCQDYAHIMISGLRALGLPAAYVSGFIRTLPPPGQARREGADSMHAWVIAWCGPEAGWFAIDPTNALIVSDEHVAVAIGRDYADVAPLDGVIVTTGVQRAVDVVVDMAPM